MTTRVLPSEEWTKLAGTELERVLPALEPDRTVVVVVEDGDQVVGCWALIQVLHAECVWVAPAHRKRAGVARRLVDGVFLAARQLGARTVWTGATEAGIERLIVKHLGAMPVPGKQFVFGTGG